MSDNKVTLDQLDNSAVEAMSSSVGDVNMLNTENKTIVGALAEIVGKKEIANAIGEPLAETDKFTEMSSEINGLLSTFKTNMMNAGVVVESGDKFKALIDKIKGLTEGEGNKGIQFAEGDLNVNIPYNNSQWLDAGEIVVPLTLDFTPTYIFIDISIYNSNLELYNNDFYISNMLSSKIVSGNVNGYFSLKNVSSDGFTISYPRRPPNYVTITNKYYAIGVGEEDTSLRDSLADILEDEGVDVTEEDDMASLITKVDEEFDRKNVGKNGLVDVIKEKGVTKAEYTDSWETIYEYINKYFKCQYVNIDISPNTWATGTAMPKGLAFASSAVIGKKIYITGGYISSAQKTVYIYDTETHQWSQGPNLNVARYGHKTVAVGTKLYVLCGEDITSCECWDTENGTAWSTIKAYSYGYSAPYGACASEDGKYIYLLNYYDGYTSLSKYNIAANSWSKPESPHFGSDYSVSNDHRFMVEVDGVLYVLFSNKCLYTTNFYSYNVVTSNAPTFSNEFGLATVFDSKTRRIITIENTKVHIFDLDTNKYNTISTGSTSLYGRFASCVDGIIYIFGGTTRLDDYGNITGSTSTDTKIYMPPEE